MEPNASTMFSAGMSGVGDTVSGPLDTSVNRRQAALSASADEDPTRVPRLQNPAALLRRQNVEYVLMLVGARALRISAEMADGTTDTKTIAVGDMGGGVAGCFVLLRLMDNPLGLSAGFFELRLGEEGGVPAGDR